VSTVDRSVIAWRERLDTPEPAAFQRAVFDVAQVAAYQPIEQRARLAQLVVGHAAARHPELAVRWVEGLFRIGGNEAMQAMVEHAASGEGSVASRKLASRRIAEMRREREAELRLRTNADARLALPVGALSSVALPREREPQGYAVVSAHLGRMPIEQHREQLLGAGFAPAFAVDCDGTLWKGDIGEALLLRAIERRWLLPKANKKLRALLSRYKLPVAKDVNDNGRRLADAFFSGELARAGEARGIEPRLTTAEFYAACAWCFAGHPIDRLKIWARTMFEESGGFAGKIFLGAAEVVEAGRSAGLVPYAISASCQWLVEIGAEYAGIPPWRVAGVRCPVDEEDRLDSEVEAPITYGPGKVAGIERHTGGRAVLAMGDAVDGTDREMLESSLARIAVNPTDARRRYLAERRDDNWCVLQFERTLSGESAAHSPAGK
jgi:phosphoserine phosphatase